MHAIHGNHVEYRLDCRHQQYQEHEPDDGENRSPQVFIGKYSVQCKMPSAAVAENQRHLRKGKGREYHCMSHIHAIVHAYPIGGQCADRYKDTLKYNTENQHIFYK